MTRLLGLILVALGNFVSAGERPRNVLVLFTDDQRTDTIRAWGNPHLDTPSLDRLAAVGMSFRRNYCFGSWHGAVCVPSRAMLMTGRHLFDVDASMTGAVTFPQLLGSHGWTTFATGKWHNGPESLQKSFQRGRDIMMGGMSDHFAAPLHDLTDGELGKKPLDDRHTSEIYADAAIEFLRSHDADEPFVCYVAFQAPHDPRDAPVAFRQKYATQHPPLPDNFLPQHPFDNGQMALRDEYLAPLPRPREVVAQQLAEYYALIEHADGQIGRILDAVDELKLADETLIVFAADHGLALGSHGLLGKQSVYEHSMGCPMILSGPGVPKGAQTEAFSYLYDLFPTVCELLGVDPPAGLAGESLAPLLADPSAGVRDSVFLSYGKWMRSIRDERWKLIRYPQINHTQLFDLESDPSERHDLARDPGRVAQIDALTARMHSWRSRVGDTLPLERDRPDPMEFDRSRFQRTPDRWQPDWILEKYFGN